MGIFQKTAIVLAGVVLVASNVQAQPAEGEWSGKVVSADPKLTS